MENNTDCDEGVVFPPGSTAAVSVALPTENNLDVGTTATPDDDEEWVNVEIETVSKKKMEKINVEEVKDGELFGNRLFDLCIIKTLFSIMICPHCKTQGLYLQEASKQGLAFKYILTCQDAVNCCWSYSFFNSPRTKKNNSLFTRSFDVNPRTVYSIRRLGKGYAGLETFLFLMNHPPPMSEKSYRETNVKLCDTVQVVAEKSLKDDVEEVKVIEGVRVDGYCYTSVSVEGTWHRRGFSSLNGAVAAISMNNGKVLDVVAMSRHCQGCVNINALENNDGLMKLKADHNCSITHIGSVPVMETKGTEKIFNRSKDNGIIYNGYYGE